MKETDVKVTWNRQNITAGFRTCCYVGGSCILLWIIVALVGDDVASIFKIFFSICVEGVRWLSTSVGNFFDRVEAKLTLPHTLIIILLCLLLWRIGRLEERLDKQERDNHRK